MTEKKQSTLDFYGITKDKSNSLRGIETQSSDYPRENRDRDRVHDNVLMRIENKATINLENSFTYALPTHIPRIWSFVKPKLQELKRGNIIEIHEFIETIQSFIQCHYRNTLKNNKLTVLETLIESLRVEDRDFFFKILVPKLAELVLETDSLFPEPLFILKQNSNSSVKFTKKQVACLISHMFFCLLHKQNNTNLRLDCNFSSLYRNSYKSDVKLEKLKCIYNYFKRIYRDVLEKSSLDTQYIVFERLIYKSKLHGDIDVKFWERNETPLRECEIKDSGTLEEEDGCVQVDFANRMIGGGILDGGCVQEEIRFLVSPETFASLLFVESLLDHEALMMIGTEKFNKYDGYSNTFRFIKGIKDPTEVDSSSKIRKSIILAIDAIDFSKTSSPKIQFKIERILRELNKAYIGFHGESKEIKLKYPIGTGRWGCGVFLGDSQLKFILQWLAASVANKDMIFYRFEDKNLADAEKIIKKLRNSTVGEVFESLKSYSSLTFTNKEEMPLFEALLYVL